MQSKLSWLALAALAVAWYLLRHTEPGYREYHAMAGLPDQVVLFGGQSGHDSTFPPMNDTWRWNGRWREVWAGNPPPPRAGHAMCADVTPGRALLFGGFEQLQMSGPRKLFGDTWIFDGSGWVEMKSAVSPPPAAGAVMALDPDQKCVVLVADRTYEWDGAAWKAAGTAPAGLAMCYDASRRAMVLLAANADLEVETWLRAGAGWSRTPAARLPHASYAMAYLPDRKEIVAVGGDPLTVRAWNGTEWVVRSATPAPPARSFHALACDPVSRKLILNAGRHHKGDSMFENMQWRDTWTFDGAAWTPHGE